MAVDQEHVGTIFEACEKRIEEERVSSWRGVNWVDSRNESYVVTSTVEADGTGEY